MSEFRNRHSGPRAATFSDYVKNNYTRTGLSDQAFANLAQNTLRFACTPSNVHHCRLTLGIPSNRAKQPAAAPIAMQPQGETMLVVPGHATKRDVEALLAMMASLEARMSMAEAALRAARHDAMAQKQPRVWLSNGARA